MKFVATLALLLLPAVTFAAVPTWDIIQTQSSINFTATQNGFIIKLTMKEPL